MPSRVSLSRPNILFLMADQMQGRVLESGHPCRTPHIDRLADRGLRFRNAYTPNAVCSPARASLMTGLLPHNHGVLWVHHCVDPDQGLLRTDCPHWAQRLQAAGYRTGYFGKWHVEHTESPGDFGWEHDGSTESAAFAGDPREAAHPDADPDFLSVRRYRTPGYRDSVFYGVTGIPPERRPMGKITAMAGDWLAEVVSDDRPWCCFVSVPEPHDPFICGAEARSLVDAAGLPVPANWSDDLEGRPGLYRKAAGIWADMTVDEKREAAACYYASIAEIDGLFGGLVARVEAAGQLENTIIVVAGDHGELLGAHGMYCKNVGASEEIYNIPLVVAGPGVRTGVSDARVGLHDLCPTLLELTGASSFSRPDSRSFAPLLAAPQEPGEWERGFAEYHGGRYLLTQRVLWDGDWKLVHNGFDRDELYHLASDPFELRNLADDPEHQDRLERLMSLLWDRVRETGDTSLLRSHYPILRLAPVGPDFGTR